MGTNPFNDQTFSPRDLLTFERGGGARPVMETRVTGEDYPRLRLLADGTLLAGDGTIEPADAIATSADVAVVTAAIAAIDEPTNTLGIEWTSASGLARAYPVAHSAAVKTTAVANTTDETSLLTSNLAVPGVTVNDRLDLRFTGVIGNDSGGNVDVTLTLKQDTTAIVTIPLSGLADIGSAYYQFEGRLSLRQIDFLTVGYMTGTGTFTHSDAGMNGGATSAASVYQLYPTASIGAAYPATWDTDFDLTVDFSAADPSVNCALNTFDVTVLRRT